MSFTDLPAVNAGLNSLSTVLLTAGFVFIKRGNKTAHRNCMVAALVTSTGAVRGPCTPIGVRRGWRGRRPPDLVRHGPAFPAIPSGTASSRRGAGPSKWKSTTNP